MQNNYQDLKNVVSEDCFNYLQQNQSDFSVFQYKSTIQDLQDESDLCI